VLRPGHRRQERAEENPGRAAYLRYCSACHGTDGRGDGVVATVMRPKPTDLTQLAKAHGGKFPYVQVRDIIDGRKRTAAHGTSEMPVWGEVFREQKAAAQPDANVRGQVQLITDYLSTIQVQ
jgi:mono/diheme cytochrome c family protein